MRSWPPLSLLLVGTLAVAVSTWPAHAQDRESRPPRHEPDHERSRIHPPWIWFGDGERAVLGLSTASSGKRDTLGLLITRITPGGPAEKAGLVEGNRIESINGVSLRLAPADAGEPDMEGLTTRRLQRVLEKTTPGDEVELRVHADGRSRTVKVKTVDPAQLAGRSARFARHDQEDRAAIGVTLSGSGSRRDTLGVLIVRVAPNGPAEKAGLVEGDRIVAINGVDLRAPRGERGESAHRASADRLRRELRDMKPGANVELRVYSGGKFKTVRLKAARESEVYTGPVWRRLIPDGLAELAIPPEPLLAPRPALPPPPPEIEIDIENDIDDEVRRETERHLRESDGRLRDMIRELRRRWHSRERVIAL